jgi:hypothetical protein
MAPPYRWNDEFQDAGWPARLSPAALRLVLAVGRRVDRHTRATRIALERLRSEAALPRRTFFDAKRELHCHGLVQRVKVTGQRTATLVLTLPVPKVPFTAPVNATRRTSRCDPSHFRVRSTAPADGRKPHRTRKTAASYKQTKEPTKEQTEGQLRGLEAYLKTQGVPREFAPSFMAALHTVKTLPAAARSAAVADAADDLARRLAAADVRLRGMMPYTDAVAAVLADTLAIAHPFTQKALEVFNGEIAVWVADA